MTADKPTHLVLKLRFPEFRDSGEWETRKLGDIVSRNKETFDPQKSRDTPHLIELENIESKTGQILGVAELEKHNSLKSRFQAGDVLFGKLRPYLQKFARPDFQGVCTSEIWVLRGKEISSAFLFYLVQTERFIQLANISSGSRMPRAEWNFLAGADFKIPRPDEQRKIADCLGSLDALIATEGRKLEALRKHKQGLMQQLLPQPGETVPRLRFPEFRNAADWKTKILGTQGSFLSSLTGKTAKDFDTGGAAFIPYMNVFSNTFTKTTELRSVNLAGDESQNAVVKGDVFFTVSSETPEEAGMSSVLLEEIGNCYLNSFCALFRFDEGKSPDTVFLGYLLRSAPTREHLSRGAQGATRYNISRSTFRSLPILIPTGPEQKKIADCLTSIDDQLNAHACKLDMLKQHKQGLLQQLFPSLDGQ